MNSKVVLGVIVAVAIMGTIILAAGTTVLQSYAINSAIFDKKQASFDVLRKAPTAISGNNVYITWFTNEGTVNSNFEVGFRASNDSGATFGPIMNLSNTANSDSINTEISAEGGKVIVSWWEKNQTSMVPVARVSTDFGHTFGPRLNITTNPFGTIGAAKGK